MFSRYRRIASGTIMSRGRAAHAVHEREEQVIEDELSGTNSE